MCVPRSALRLLHREPHETKFVRILATLDRISRGNCRTVDHHRELRTTRIKCCTATFARQGAKLNCALHFASDRRSTLMRTRTAKYLGPIFLLGAASLVTPAFAAGLIGGVSGGVSGGLGGLNSDTDNSVDGTFGKHKVHSSA